MGKSKNPDGKAKVTDRELIDALEDAISTATDDTLAVPAHEVAEFVPVKKQAAGKRLNHLSLDKSTAVKRFKGSQAWLYYLDRPEDGDLNSKDEMGKWVQARANVALTSLSVIQSMDDPAAVKVAWLGLEMAAEISGVGIDEYAEEIPDEILELLEGDPFDD